MHFADSGLLSLLKALLTMLFEFLQLFGYVRSLTLLATLYFGDVTLYCPSQFLEYFLVSRHTLFDDLPLLIILFSKSVRFCSELPVSVVLTLVVHRLRNLLLYGLIYAA